MISARPYRTAHSTIGRPFIQLPCRSWSRSSLQTTLFSINTLQDKSPRFWIRSSTTDPYINLAVEDYVLRNSDLQSHILFTYVNRPCVVIGRNQNPWTEVNLAALKHGVGSQQVDLIRRRSGGGTVFHDEGNLNYSFIVPNDKNFDRDKHAEMVVEAVRGLPADVTHQGELLLPHILKTGVRVNERHDIVMPARLGKDSVSVDESRTVKVSGSAYKLTRGRALHHGTLLFSSPNLEGISNYLRSPARSFIEAKGVESVRSPIGNLRYSPKPSLRGALRTELERSIATVFDATYKAGPLSVTNVTETSVQPGDDIDVLQTELRSSSWTYLQTPTFTFSSEPLRDSKDFRPPPIPDHLPHSARINIEVKRGTIARARVSLSGDHAIALKEAEQVERALQHTLLHEIRDWRRLFRGLDRWTDPNTQLFADWLSQMFPVL